MQQLGDEQLEELLLDAARVDALLADEVHAQRLEQVLRPLPRDLVQRVLRVRRSSLSWLLFKTTSALLGLDATGDRAGGVLARSTKTLGRDRESRGGQRTHLQQMLAPDAQDAHVRVGGGHAAVIRLRQVHAALPDQGPAARAPPLPPPSSASANSLLPGPCDSVVPSIVGVLWPLVEGDALLRRAVTSRAAMARSST